MTLDELYVTIIERRRLRPAGSYVAELFEAGTDRIVQKVGEEAVEVVIAAKNGQREAIVSETADLLFHVLVMLADSGVTPAEVMQELSNRRVRTLS